MRQLAGLHCCMAVMAGWRYREVALAGERYRCAVKTGWHAFGRDSCRDRMGDMPLKREGSQLPPTASASHGH